MRHFIFTWAAIEKHGKAIMRNNKITVLNTTGDIGHDAKSAVNIFTANFGNLKKNEIFSIQEVDENGKSIGEPILPTEGENAIVPSIV